MLSLQLKFYATQGLKSRQLFCFGITDLHRGGLLLSRFKANKAIIHKAYLNVVAESGRVYNYPLNLTIYWLTGVLIPELSSLK